MLNQTIFLAINDSVGHSIWLDRGAIFFAEYSGYVLIAILIFVYLENRTRKNFLMLVHSFFAGLIARAVFVELIHYAYPHPRPFVAMPVHQLIPESGSSFPSGHASFFFAISTVVFMHNRKLGTLFLIVSTIMGVARVFVGVHWPADIIGGIVVGILSALIVESGSLKLFRSFIKKAI